jgi:hypothetical protein
MAGLITHIVFLVVLTAQGSVAELAEQVEASAFGTFRRSSSVPVMRREEQMGKTQVQFSAHGETEVRLHDFQNIGGRAAKAEKTKSDEKEYCNKIFVLGSMTDYCTGTAKIIELPMMMTSRAKTVTQSDAS